MFKNMGRNFHGWEFDGWEFSGWEFSWYRLIDVPTRDFFHPGHSYSNLHPINHWGKFQTQTIVYRNTWLGNWKILIIDLIVNIILDYLKKTVHNVFTITTNIQGSVL